MKKRLRQRGSAKRASRRVEHQLTTDRWRQVYPELGAAYRAAVARFLGLPGVLGVGMGRKYLERKGEYAPPTTEQGGLCVKILVAKKKPPSRLKVPSHRIPRHLIVSSDRSGREVRVPTDIVEVGHPELCNGNRTLPSDRRAMGIGLAFSTGMPTGDSSDGTFDAIDPNPQVGTLGAAIKMKNGSSVWGVSAGHVFVNYEGDPPDFDAPAGFRAFGVAGLDWTRGTPAFNPTSLLRNQLVTDALLFALPQKFSSAPFIWPALCDSGQFASSDDIDNAIHADGVNGFVWVDRNEPSPVKIKIHLHSNVENYPVAGNSPGSYRYVPIWQYMFEEEEEASHPPVHPTTTIAGDSGSPVFIKRADGLGFRLLGFHFMEDIDESVGFAMDATSFFAEFLDSVVGGDFILA